MPAEKAQLSGLGEHILEVLERRGACFFQELVQQTRQLSGNVKQGLAELVSLGLVTCDGFAGLRDLIAPQRRPVPNRPRSPRGRKLILRTVDRTAAGRWSKLERGTAGEVDAAGLVEFSARQLLKRYGVVFHKLLIRESHTPPWRELLRVYRRMEARGEIRGGRFITGFSGEQYALPEAVGQLRAMRQNQAARKSRDRQRRGPAEHGGHSDAWRSCAIAVWQSHPLQGRRACGGQGERQHHPPGVVGPELVACRSCCSSWVTR